MEENREIDILFKITICNVAERICGKKKRIFKRKLADRIHNNKNVESATSERNL